MRHFPGAGNYRECDVANLAEPAPTLAFLLRRHTRNRELRYATLGDCREPDYRLWRTFWIIGLGWDQTSRGFGFIISGTAMRRSSCSPECIPSRQERFWHSTVTTTLDLYSRVTATMQEDLPAVSTPRFGVL